MEKYVELFTRLNIKGLTISSVESLTGGLFASSMTSQQGASRVFKGAMVTYMTEEKVKLLGIRKDIITTYGVISPEVAYLMAKYGKEKMESDVCVSFTGNAGPDAMEDRPVGLVYIGIACGDVIKTFGCRFDGDRDAIRKQCVNKASELIMEHFLKEN